MNVYECNGTNIFMRWKMKCSIQRGEAELNGIFHLSPNENICSIARMRKHSLFLFYITCTKIQVLKQIWKKKHCKMILASGWHSYTFTTWIAVDTTRNCRLQSWTLHKSADCRWISITILYESFTNSATVRRLEQVQLCNRLIDQSADNITGLKCAKECLILKYWF